MITPIFDHNSEQTHISTYVFVFCICQLLPNFFRFFLLDMYRTALYWRSLARRRQGRRSPTMIRSDTMILGRTSKDSDQFDPSQARPTRSLLHSLTTHAQRKEEKRREQQRQRRKRKKEKRKEKLSNHVCAPVLIRILKSDVVDWFLFRRMVGKIMFLFLTPTNCSTYVTISWCMQLPWRRPLTQIVRANHGQFCH